jgi:hypothetical protein
LRGATISRWLPADLVQLVGAGSGCGQYGEQDATSRWRDVIAVRVRDLLNQGVGTEHPQPAADDGGTATSFGDGFRRSVVEDGLQIPVPESIASCSPY